MKKALPQMVQDQLPLACQLPVSLLYFQYENSNSLLTDL